MSENTILATLNDAQLPLYAAPAGLTAFYTTDVSVSEGDGPYNTIRLPDGALIGDRATVRVDGAPGYDGVVTYTAGETVIAQGARNSFVWDGTAWHPTIRSYTGSDGAVAIDPTAEEVLLIGARDGLFSLADGVEYGHEITLYYLNGTGTCTVRPTTWSVPAGGGGPSSIVLTAGGAARAKWNGTKWYPLVPVYGVSIDIPA